MDYSSILKNLARHIELDPSEIELFVSTVQYKKIKKRDVLLEYGQVCKATTFVKSGCLRSYNFTDQGIQVIQFAIADWWIGDLKSFVHQTPSELCVDALMDTEIFQIPRSKLEILYERVPKFERFFRIQMENALIAHQDRILQAHKLSSKERYESFLSTYPDFYKNIPLKDIANYLGITPEHLSTIRNLKK